MIRDLLHADRILKLIAAGLTYPQAVRVSDKDAALLIEAWEIAGCEVDDDDGDCLVVVVE